MSTNLGDVLGSAELAAGEACAECGFRPDDVSPSDALATLRSFPRRWHSALAVHLDDRDPEVMLVGRPSPGGWTALEHAGHVRDVLHALDIRLQRVLREDDPVLPETHVTPPSGANEQGMAVVLAVLGVSSAQLTRTVELTPATAWSRSAQRARRPVTALDLVREAVHEGVHHLRQATVTLETLRMATSAVS